ncbi:PRC-barrel domain-containing protein [Agromyces aurantiacus]|uniref:PRC-barrel domain-containing protein n=1 Tax=Agromyces aurantiacus TaxID=165814 RepID=A0ABV9R2E2_9MICO|nr:PRC-barrel domain-containing protein [Agromyces aurantiacus]MBM7502967.1 sporulation protein YlmC with PRC-barrel domain [Agromyces aurantiacus]
MILSELLGSEVVDAAGDRVGSVVDARFAIDGAPGQLLAAPRLVGLLVSPRSRTSMWGYERTGVSAPWPIAHYLRRVHRGLFLAAWADIARVDEGRVVLRTGFERHDPRLRTAAQGS